MQGIESYVTTSIIVKPGVEADIYLDGLQVQGRDAKYALKLALGISVNVSSQGKEKADCDRAANYRQNIFAQ